MPATPPVFTVAYTLKAAFSGAPNTVTALTPADIGGLSVSPLVTQPTPGQAYAQVVSATDPTQGIKVVGQVALNITVSDGTRSNTLYPLGLAVQNPGVRTRPSASTFPQAVIAPVVNGVTPVISLTDTASNDTNPNGTTYEFVLLFQDINGWFGTLDPRIINDLT